MITKSMMGDAMPLYRLLKETVFEPETVEVMGHAYEALLIDLEVADRADPFTEIVAKQVIEVASTGVRNSDEIRKQVLGSLTKPG